MENEINKTRRKLQFAQNALNNAKRVQGNTVGKATEIRMLERKLHILKNKTK